MQILLLHDWQNYLMDNGKKENSFYSLGEVVYEHWNCLIEGLVLQLRQKKDNKCKCEWNKPE